MVDVRVRLGVSKLLGQMWDRVSLWTGLIVRVISGLGL